MKLNIHNLYEKCRPNCVVTSTTSVFGHSYAMIFLANPNFFSNNSTDTGHYYGRFKYSCRKDLALAAPALVLGWRAGAQAILAFICEAGRNYALR
jgi:hypothetical protein